MALNHVNQLTDNDLRLVTLGGLEVVGGTAEASALNRQRRKLAVLALLALSKRPIPRDALVAMFWGEQDEARARHSLTEALSHIRRALGRNVIDARLSEVVLATPRVIQVDAIDFAEAVSAGDHARVVSLYGGAFLDGVHLDDAPAFNDWADGQRARFQTSFTRSAEQECMSLARARRWSDCGGLAERWLEADPTSVDAALYRLNALKANGDRPALTHALAEYQRLRTVLRREYDDEPGAAVTALADDIGRRLELMPTAAPVVDPSVHERGAALLDQSSVTSIATPDLAARNVDATPHVRRRRRVTGGLVALALVAAVALLVGRRDRWSDARSTERRSVAVAVMPFAYIGRDSSDEYLAHGVTEELSAALGKTPGVRIMAGGAGRAGAEPKDRAAFARAVGADAVIDGSVRSGSGRIRVTARLTSATSRNQLWAETYEGSAGDVLSVERDIATSVARALGSHLGASIGAIAAGRPVDAVTHDLYLRGRYFHNRSGVAALDQAAAYYRRALDRDSMHAPSWAGLAGVSLTKFNWGFSYGESVTPARAFVERSLTLDPGLSEAHVTYAQLLRYDWRWQDAALELERALTLNPSDVTARHSLSHLYFALQRPDAALVEAQRALALDPLNPRIGMHLCVAHLVARQYAEALSACRRGIELDPSFPDSHAKLAWALLRRGELAESRRELDREMAGSGRTPQYLIQLALLDAYDGQQARSRSLADSLVRSTPPARLQYPLLAVVYARLGDRSKTLAMLDAAVMAHSDEIEEIVIAPELDAMRGDSSYRQVVQRLGLTRGTSAH